MTVTVTCEICGAVIEGGYDSETGYTQQYCNYHLKALRDIEQRHNSQRQWMEQDHYAEEQRLKQAQADEIAAYIDSEIAKLSAALEDGVGE